MIDYRIDWFDFGIQAEELIGTLTFIGDVNIVKHRSVEIGSISSDLCSIGSTFCHLLYDSLGYHAHRCAKVAGLIDNRVIVHGLVWHLSGQYLHDAERIGVLYDIGIAGYDGCQPCKLRGHGIEFSHAQQLIACGHGCQELGCLRIIADAEHGETTGRRTGDDGGRQGGIPAICRHVQLILSFRQQAEGAIGIVIKESLWGRDFIKGDMVEKAADFNGSKDTCAASAHHDRQLWLTSGRSAQAKTTVGIHLLYLHNEIDIGIVFTRIGEGDIEIIGGLRDIEHYLRRQDGLRRGDSHRDVLSTQGTKLEIESGKYRMEY